MTTFAAINFSNLPVADVLETVAFETLLEEIKASFIALYPDGESVMALESDPIVKLLQVAAYRETILRSRINLSASAVMLATASGADLDNLAALVPVSRLDQEEDDAFRARIQLAPEGFSTAGPQGAYEFHAKSARADITDVFVETPVPGDVDIYIYVQEGDALSAAIDEVQAYLGGDEIRPLTDNVEVKAFIAVEFNIDADLTFSSSVNNATVHAASLLSVTEYLKTRQGFGRDITRAGLLAAFFVEGVENVTLSSPAADVVIGDKEVAQLTTLSLGPDLEAGGV